MSFRSMGMNLVSIVTSAVLLGLTSVPLCGQNLVPNHSFEEIDDCDITLSTLATGWKVASVGGTPDLFHACATDSFFTTPYPLSCDTLLPHSGVAYAGLIVYGDFVREYLQIEIAQPLIADVPYYVSFQVAPSSSCIHSLARFTDAIGLAFSDTAVLQDLPHSGEFPLTLEPVIENRGTVIDQLGEWTTISGCYQAQGGESHIVLGSFVADEATLVWTIMPWQTATQNYLYIDDIIVEPFNPLPDSMLLCADQLEITGEFLDSVLFWSTGQTGNSITVSQPGLYTAEIVIDGCLFRDSIFVIDARSTGTVTVRDTLCPDTPLVLESQLPGTYLWSDGSTSSTLLVNTPAAYALTVSNDCGESIVNFAISSGDCACSIFVPNAFSPNGDGVNDFLQATLSCSVEHQFKSFTVYNRWGQEVYSTNDSSFTWDPQYDQTRLPAGVYVWILEYEILDYAGLVTRATSGDITILR